MRFTRGQAVRPNAAVVVLLIGLIIILYILFLPPAEREGLLAGSGGGGGGGYVPNPGGPVSGGITLMAKYVGTLQGRSSSEVTHALPPTTVFVSTNTEEVKFLDSLNVRSGAFSNRAEEFVFYADPAFGSNYLLTFNVDEAKGPLIIYLNGQPIYNRLVTSRSPEPIRLPREYLQSENTLRFETEGSGWAFWSSNAYQLRNILISADVADFRGATSEQHFTITADEYSRLSVGRLEFVPECSATETGRLTVHVNGRLLYSGYAECGLLMRQDVAPELLGLGDNTVAFTSDRGAYQLDRLRIISLLKQDEYPVYYFNLPPDMFEQVNAFAGRLVVTLRFTDGNTEKTGSMVINGFQDTFQTRNYFFQATIDPNIIIPNANSIQIIPQSDALNIAELRVELFG